MPWSEATCRAGVLCSTSKGCHSLCDFKSSASKGTRTHTQARKHTTRTEHEAHAHIRSHTPRHTHADRDQELSVAEAVLRASEAELAGQLSTAAGRLLPFVEAERASQEQQGARASLGWVGPLSRRAAIGARARACSFMRTLPPFFPVLGLLVGGLGWRWGPHSGAEVVAGSSTEVLSHCGGGAAAILGEGRASACALLCAREGGLCTCWAEAVPCMAYAGGTQLQPWCATCTLPPGRRSSRASATASELAELKAAVEAQRATAEELRAEAARAVQVSLWVCVRSAVRACGRALLSMHDSEPVCCVEGVGALPHSAPGGWPTLLLLLLLANPVLMAVAAG